jgi:hypothetical protein
MRTMGIDPKAVCKQPFLDLLWLNNRLFNPADIKK